MPKEIHFHACVFYAIAVSDRLPINRNTGKVIVSYFFFRFIVHTSFCDTFRNTNVLKFVNKTNFRGKIQTYVTGKERSRNIKRKKIGNNDFSSTNLQLHSSKLPAYFRKKRPETSSIAQHSQGEIKIKSISLFWICKFSGFPAR